MRLTFARPVLACCLLLAAGCQHAPRASVPARTRPPAYALAVTVRGGLHPSPSQWAVIQSTFARALAANGLVLVTDTGLADRILRIDFIPDPKDPENRGQAIIVGVRVNELREITFAPSPLAGGAYPFPSSFGWNSYAWGGLYPGFGWDSYYGYGNAYFDGYTYATPTLNPRRPKPAPGFCPTDLAHHPRHPRPPDGPSPHRRTVPPAEAPTPPLLAAAEAAPAAAAPRVYPSSDPRELVFADDVRRHAFNRPGGWAASGDPEHRRFSAERSVDSGDSSTAPARRPRIWGDPERGYARAENAPSREGRVRDENARYRTDDAQQERTAHDSSRTSYQSSHSHASSPSSPSYSAPAYSAPDPGGASYSAGGASTPVGGSGPAAAPTTINTEEK